MAKIPWDKYYTSPNVARWCIDKTYEIIGKVNITEVIEPSAGCGMFSLQIPNCIAYDLYPQSEHIKQADFIKLDLGGYKKGRLFIGNPPFGAGSGKILKDFYNKCTNDGDYIAFIQPASYCNNYYRFYKFEIVYSCILKTSYSNVELYTSFTIYKRNPYKSDFRSNEIELKDVKLSLNLRSNKKNNHKINIDYDYCIVGFGGGILNTTSPYKNCKTISIKCNNPKNKDEIITFFKWLRIYNKETKILSKKCISSENIEIKDILKLLKICIKDIK